MVMWIDGGSIWRRRTKSSYNVTISVQIGLVVVLKNNLVYILKLPIKKTFQDAFVSLLFQNGYYFLNDSRMCNTFSTKTIASSFENILLDSCLLYALCKIDSIATIEML